MQMRALGSSNIQASVIGFGAWAIGGWMWGGSDEQESIAAIQAGIDAGINFIDTAPAYGFGYSEELVAKAIAGRRDKVVLATKCGLRWDRTDGVFKFHSDGKDIYECLKPDSIQQEIELSLKRLKTDCIDLYQTHWQDKSTPIADSMAVLMDLKKQGKIKAIGVSNATPEQMDEYRKVGPVEVDQEKYSMIDRALEAQTLPYCLKNNIAVLAYSPMSRGLLTGKVGPERVFPQGDARGGLARFSVANRAKIATLLDALQPIAAAHKVTMGQLVLAWTVHQPGLTHALAGARNPQQAKENAAAGNVKLSAGELKTMREAIERLGAGIE